MEKTVSAETRGLRYSPIKVERIVIIVGLALVLAITSQVPWLKELPTAWELPIKSGLGGALDWLVKDATLVGVKIPEITRSIAWFFSQPFGWVNSLLWEGFEFDSGRVAPLAWLTIVAGAVLAGWRLGGRRLAVIAAVTLGYSVVFGYWISAMKTLSSILMVVPICFVFGIVLGAAAYAFPNARRFINTSLDFAQTVPVFAYLVPILLLFGFGPLSAMIATLIYAMPPMVRATLLGLENVPASIKESGLMAGATPRQLMWRIMVPSAQKSLLLGLNQVIMLSLNAVIIASLIGAGGLGYDVMRALKSLRVGQGLEAGIAIVLLAILLDKFSRAYITRAPRVDGARKSLTTVALFFALLVGGQTLSTFFPWLSVFPKDWTVTTAPYWDKALDYVVLNYYGVIEGVKNVLLLNAMLPLKAFLGWLPWAFTMALLALAGLRMSGPGLALSLVAMAAFILFSGFWAEAMISLYLVGLSVAIALLIGLPLGIWASTNDRVSTAMTAFTDTLQTLPSFVYLIPVVMLFQSGDVPAIFAVVAYALAPIIRYTDVGLRKVPSDLVEAATSIGCTRMQVLFKVKWFSALPEIVLGVNQTIMLALSMLVITALVGTSDLGQEVYIGLARTDTGRGFVAGTCVALIAIIFDRLLQAYVKDKKAKLGQ